MERLSGLDASFLYGETPETPTHTAPLWVFEPPPEGKNPFESFREHIKGRLHLLPFFQRKLVLSPIQSQPARRLSACCPCPDLQRAGSAQGEILPRREDAPRLSGVRDWARAGAEHHIDQLFGPA